MIQGMKLITFDEMQTELMKSPGYKERYDELELEFSLIREIIRQRNEKGMTQAKLAEKMGTKQSAIARFESGIGNPTLDFLKRLSSALGLTLSVTVR